MQTEPTSSIDISAMALQVFSREELTQMSQPSLLTLGHLLKQRALRPGAPPTHNELLGIRELVLEHLSHPALASLSKELPTSPTASSPTSVSPTPTAPPSDAPLGGPTL